MAQHNEQQDRLWWEWTRSLGRSAFLKRCAFAVGLPQGALTYLLFRGSLWLVGDSTPRDPLEQAFGAVGFLSIYALCYYFAGARQWDRYTQKYDSVPPSTLPPDHALQRTEAGLEAATDQRA